jgi:ABC-type multidrug transport system ATPase subunit
MITIKNIFFKYSKQNVLNDVSLQIEENSVFGIIGVNGSGKTTLLKIILQILQPKSGYIENHFAGKIGVVLEEIGMFPDMTVENNLKISALLKNVNYNKIDDALKKVGLFEKKKSKVKTLSNGMKKKLSIAAALIGSPELLILDEPTNGLDPLSIVEIRELIESISKTGKTIVIASHILTELEKICTHIAIVNKGEIIENGTINQVLLGYDSLEMAFIHNLKKHII